MPSRTSELPANLQATQTAIRQGPGGQLMVENHAIVPHLEPEMVLVRVAAVALNPTDYKMPARFPSPGALVGSDFAGAIAAVGAAVTGLAVGDRVCGAVHGNNPTDKATGAFANYVRVPGSMAIRVPESMSWEQAATIGGVCHGTVALALWGESNLHLTASPYNPAAQEYSSAVLVYGASTATGTMALQLLRLSGFKPIAVCSSRNFALARKYGAAAVFDYTSPTCSDDIRTYTGNAMRYCIDCIADAPSAELCYAAIGRAGGHYVCLEMQQPGTLPPRRAVRCEFLLGYEIFGREIALSDGYERPARPASHELGKHWFATMERLLKEGRVTPHPSKIVGHDWQHVLDGLEELRKGNVSGYKMVVELQP